MEDGWYSDRRSRRCSPAPGIPRELNPRAIPAYLTFGYVPTPETFFRGIVSLPPGHVLTYSPGAEPVIERYWSLAVAGVNGVEMLDVGLEEAAELVRSALRRAVERRMVADVPLGAFLSGGVDSSAIVALMSQISDRPVKTFTIGFEGEELFDERPYARRVAQLFRTEHHEHVVRPNAIELVETLLWHHDQPFGDSSAIPTYLVSQLTREDVTVALSGDGGDELFAGYERFAAALALRRYRRAPAAVRHALAGAVDRLPPGWLAGRVESAQRFAGAGDMPTLDGYRTWVGFFDESARCQLLPGADDWALRDYASQWALSSGAAPLDRLLALNATTYLLDDLLVKADRMSMAHALEVRSPFLDIELLELAFRLPPQVKLHRYRRKLGLVEGVRDVLPSEILSRRKRGFAVPLDHWFREDLQDYLGAMLGSPKARLREHMRIGTVDRLIAEHNSSQRNHGQRLWLLLALELFLTARRLVDGTMSVQRQRVAVGLLAVSPHMWLLDMPLLVPTWTVGTLAASAIGLSGVPNPYRLPVWDEFDAILLCAEWCKWLDATVPDKRASVLRHLRRRTKVLAVIDGHDGFALAVPPDWFDNVDVVLKGQGLFRDRDLYNRKVGPRHGPASPAGTTTPRRRRYSSHQLEKLRLAPPCFLHVHPAFRAAVRRVKPGISAGAAAARSFGDRLIEMSLTCQREVTRPAMGFTFWGTLTSMDRLELLTYVRQRNLPGDYGIVAVPELIYGSHIETVDSSRSVDPEESEMRIAPPSPRYLREHPYTSSMEGVPLRTTSADRTLVMRQLTELQVVRRPVSRPALRRRALRHHATIAAPGYGELTFRHGEALAAGRVLVCPDLTGVETHFPFRNGENVIYCRPDFRDLDTIAEELVRDEQWARRVAERGLSSWRQWSREWRDILDRGLAEPIRTELGQPEKVGHQWPSGSDQLAT